MGMGFYFIKRIGRKERMLLKKTASILSSFLMPPLLDGDSLAAGKPFTERGRIYTKERT
jgi:hypothetical protein